MSLQKSFLNRSFLLIPLFAMALAISYVVAPLLPVTIGWENGPIENTQAVLLFLGGAWALKLRAASMTARTRSFWSLISPVWFIMAARELSWGAVLRQPIGFSQLTGPVFSSTRQLWYKPAILPIVLAILACCVWTFIRTKQSETVGTLWDDHDLPLLEIGFFIVTMFASAIAEGHMGMNLDHLGEGGAQTFEELVELCGYGALLLAQWRVAKSLTSSRRTFIAQQCRA